MSKAILYDATMCIDCKLCEKACAEQKYLPYSDKVAAEDKMLAHKLSCVRAKGNKFMRRLCMNCEVPTCASVCPLGALRRTPKGLVTYGGSRCIGCHYCMLACPFEVPKYKQSSLLPRVRKRDICADRVAAGKATACPTGATHLSGLFPWSLWIGFDVFCGVMLVAWCGMLYTMVLALALEFVPIAFKGLRSGFRSSVRHGVTIALVIAGVILSTLHQFSLGSLYLIVPEKLGPLWYSPLLPVFFFAKWTEVAVTASIVAAGFAIFALAVKYLLILSEAISKEPYSVMPPLTEMTHAPL